MLFEQAAAELELIDRHLSVLRQVVENGPIGILRLADATGMQVHKVRYSLRILEQKGLIKPSPQGAVVGDNFDEFIRSAETHFRELEKLLADVENKGKEISLP